ncbi:helix-turn-helix domain-containing protein [Streptomyces sp. NPDC058657]|uniref:helix-turn-helix domain-containing protein n=1 Tax=unclassified Streptomyces TaxID=2593676 RepID=UPI00365ADC08
MTRTSRSPSTTTAAPPAPPPHGRAPALPSAKERRRLREAKALSQLQVAAIVGVTRETVRSWESGRTSPRGRKREVYTRLLTGIEQEIATTGEATPVRTVPLTPAGASRPAAPDASPTPLASLSSLASPTSLDAPVALGAPGALTAPAAPTTSGTSTSPGAPTTSSASESPTPTQAFDHLYARTAPSLLRQTYLLTGRHRLSHESVERAFDLAWQRWPEVATDRDPAGWVRAAAYEYAMSPWHRLLRRHRRIDLPKTDAPRSGTATNGNPSPDPGSGPGPGERALLRALLELPPPYRRTLVLYDGLGLDLPETAAETEATTPATAHRLEHARTVIARELPELAGVRSPAEQSALVQERLSTLALAQRTDCLRPGEAVRTKSERRTRFWTRAAIAFTTLIVGATAFTLSTAPTAYEPPRPPGEPVGGVPAHSGPQRLTTYDKQLRAKLQAELENGPERLVPQPR